MSARPVTILIAALGGEGGAVLANWIIDAAQAHDFPVQSTSVPGLAQRTGATTYYLEIYPVPRAELGGREPVFALTPTPGRVDLVAASELLEVGRVVQGGFTSAERTTLVGSTHREYTFSEKMAMGDGRHDSRKLIAGAFGASKHCALADLRSLAWKHGTVINTVLLGAMVSSGALPLTVESCEAAIRKSGKAVEASLKGFRAGLEASWLTQETAEPDSTSASGMFHGMDDLPNDARKIVAHGLELTHDYQSAAYADLYLDRVRALYAAEREWHGDFAATREASRYLALWMCFEDIIRVADLKTRRERLQKVRDEVSAKPHEPVVLTEFLKPGLEELCSVLPAGPAARLHRAFAHRGSALNVGLHVKTNTITGFLMLCGLRSLRRWRPRTSRYAAEQLQIEGWLSSVRAALRVHPGLALELALCGNLVKGYGDTAARGHKNIATILREADLLVHTEPIALTNRIALARKAALADPEGNALARSLGRTPEPAAKPLRFIRGAAKAL